MKNWSGKVIGAVLGTVAGGPIGALVGLFIGHQYDTFSEQQRFASSGDDGFSASMRTGNVAQIQSLFLPATFRLLGHIAKADGRVSEDEIAAARALMQSLRLGDAQMRQAIEYFRQGKQASFSVHQELRPLRDAMGPYPQLAQFFIELQLQAAIAGNGLSPRPRERLQWAANFLGVAQAHFTRLETMVRWRQQGPTYGRSGAGTGSSGSWSGRDAGASGSGDFANAFGTHSQRVAQAYTLLEISSRASDEEVVKAYRRQMSRHHPDKLQANGLPEAMLERAKERTQQIQSAYEVIRSARGMS